MNKNVKMFITSRYATQSKVGIDRAYFYLPVSLTVVKANDYNIKVYSQNGGELRSKDGDIIPTLSGEAGYAQRGNYYNWFAATAGSGKLTDTDSTTDGDRVIDGAVQDSICPKGWTLPAGGNSSVGITDGSVKSFYNLTQFYTGVTGFIPDVTIDTLYAFPMNFSPTGFYDHQSGEISQVGIRQTYWTNSSSTNVDYANLLNYDSGKIWPGVASVLKVHGLSIRCVAR